MGELHHRLLMIPGTLVFSWDLRQLPRSARYFKVAVDCGGEVAAGRGRCGGAGIATGVSADDGQRVGHGDVFLHGGGSYVTRQSVRPSVLARRLQHGVMKTASIIKLSKNKNKKTVSRMGRRREPWRRDSFSVSDVTQNSLPLFCQTFLFTLLSQNCKPTSSLLHIDLPFFFFLFFTD